jgi:hypothetical protein
MIMELLNSILFVGGCIFSVFLTMVAVIAILYCIAIVWAFFRMLIDIWHDKEA